VSIWRQANLPNGISSTSELATSFFIGAVGSESVMNKPMGDRYRLVKQRKNNYDKPHLNVLNTGTQS